MADSNRCQGKSHVSETQEYSSCYPPVRQLTALEAVLDKETSMAGK